MLDAAGRLFGAHRFHEVRMEDIAAEAEVGKGTIYRYFSDKEDLFVALLERSSRQLEARLEAEKARGGNARVRLHAYLKAVIEFFDERPHLFDLIQRGEVMRGVTRAFPWQKARDELFQLFLDLFKEGNALGEFRIRDPDLAMLMMLGGMRTVIRFGKRPRPRDLAKQMVESFLNGADRGARSNGVEPRATVSAGNTAKA
jgi:AcrR family transcriptional regulator